MARYSSVGKLSSGIRHPALRSYFAPSRSKKPPMEVAVENDIRSTAGSPALLLPDRDQGRPCGENVYAPVSGPFKLGSAAGRVLDIAISPKWVTLTKLIDDRSIFIIRPMILSKKAEATRQHILDTGYQLVLHKGFAGLGLLEILKACNVPKGSFYHYFSSKEAFGCALLQQYVEGYGQKLNDLLGEAGNGRERLMRYWDAWISAPDNPTLGWAEECLVVKLAAEVADLSEDMRLVLDAGVQRLLARIASLIDEAREDGSLPAGKPSPALARALYQMWLGAALLAKLSQDKLPLLEARDTTERLLTCTSAS